MDRSPPIPLLPRRPPKPGAASPTNTRRGWTILRRGPFVLFAGKGNVIPMNRRFDLSTIESFSEIPTCRARKVLSLLIELDPISGNESEQYPDSYPKEYRERVEKFSRNYIWRRITGDITIEFLEPAVERMFTADEVSSVVDLAELKELKHRIVQLFLYANDGGRNHWN